MELLTRDKFRESVFRRDNNKCCICQNPGKDAHHIIERRLWSDGGYYLDNGATLCEDCHILAEQTIISCDTIRKACNVNKVHLPEHLYDDLEYDKWGNVYLANGNRTQGELFNDESVQKILNQGGVLNQFTKYVKYARTHHLPWSNQTKDDKIIETLQYLETLDDILVTLKMDGEQCSWYKNHYHARSLEMVYGEDRALVKSMWARISHEIPEGWRFCGENLYAKHSIKYTNLESYFYLFSIWNEKNICISWDETKEWAELLGLCIVPELYRGPWNTQVIQELYQEYYNENLMEGYVVRPTTEFNFHDFKYLVAKYVRPNHVTTSNHWRNSKLECNELRI